jgi:hypothetical protein
MTMRSGWTVNGQHFRETWTTRRGAPTLLCFVDGKPTARAKFKAAMAAAKQAEQAAPRAVIEPVTIPTDDSWRTWPFAAPEAEG